MKILVSPTLILTTKNSVVDKSDKNKVFFILKWLDVKKI